MIDFHACSWPAPLSSHDGSLAAHFDKLNEPAFSRALQAGAGLPPGQQQPQGRAGREPAAPPVPCPPPLAAYVWPALVARAAPQLGAARRLPCRPTGLPSLTSCFRVCVPAGDRGGDGGGRRRAPARPLLLTLPAPPRAAARKGEPPSWFAPGLAQTSACACRCRCASVEAGAALKLHPSCACSACSSTQTWQRRRAATRWRLGCARCARWPTSSATRERE